MSRRIVLLAIVIGLSATLARADQYVYGFSGSVNNYLTITTTNGTFTAPQVFSGWYDSTGFHDSVNPNYITGSIQSLGYRDFFVFDLADITGTVQSASMTAYTWIVLTSGTETVNYCDVQTPLAVLEATQSGRTDIYNDLGGGTFYGTRGYAASDSNTYITVALNSAFVTDAQAKLGGQIAIAGADTVTGPAQVVPLPSAVLASFSLLAGLGFCMKIRHSRVAAWFKS